MKNLLTWKFWDKVIVKMIKTGAETALALMGTNMFITEVNWEIVASGTIFSMIATILFNLKSIEVEES